MNGKQIISAVIAVMGVLTVSTTQLTDLFGPQMAKSVASLAALVSAMLGGVMMAITSQSATVKDVQAMPGVEKITVNTQANPTLAAIAVDPANEKIEAKPGAEMQVARIAGEN